MIVAFCTLVAYWLLAAAPSAQPPNRAVTLKPRMPVARAIAAGQSHFYRVEAADKHLVSIVVEQQGIDVSVRVTRHDGRDVLTVDASDDDFRAERVLVIADTQGPHSISVRPVAAAKGRGRYTIHLVEVRPATMIDQRRVEAERLYEKGRTLLTPGRPADWPHAQAALTDVLAAYRELDDQSGQLKALVDLARAQENLLRPDALVSAQNAERLAREIGDDAARAAALQVAGRAQQRRGDFEAALLAHQTAADVSQALGNVRAQLTAVNSIAVVYGRTGDSAKAVEYLEQALPLARAAQASFVEFAVLNNLGIAYKDLGQYDKALDSYQRSLALRRQSGDRAGEATVLNNIGNLQRIIGNHHEALKLHTAALAITREVGGRENEARSLNTIGLTYYALANYRDALDYHRQSLAIRRELTEPLGQAASLDGMGRALHKLGRSDEALESLRQALDIRRSIRDENGEGDTLRNIAAVARDRGDLLEARRNIEAAVELEEIGRERITSPELRATFASVERDKYELFIDVLLKQHEVQPAAGHAATALQVSERARARVLLDALLEARVDVRQGIEPELLARERALQKQINETSSALSRSLQSRDRQAQAHAASDTLERLGDEYQQLQSLIRQRSPRYAALTQREPLSATEIQRSILDADTVLLEFSQGETRSWLWAVSTDALVTVTLPPRAEIDAATRKVYERVTARQPLHGESRMQYATRVKAADAGLKDATQAISQMLLGGIAGHLHGAWRGKRLAIVAGGSLEYLPFASLPLPVTPTADDAHAAPRQGGTTLASLHELVMLPSASVLALIRRELQGREPAPRTVAILADPVYEADDPRVRDGNRGSAGATSTSFSRLPFSREEAASIAALAAPGDVFRATDFAANRRTVLDGTLSQYRIVHFATHGVISSGRPALSGLVLSQVDRLGAPVDGYVRLHDIYNMRLSSGLVVLSACQTALGRDIKGEGLVSLARAFMYAGAPRVVASLWKVNDLATAELMKSFYRGMLQDGLRPAAALRAAQLRLASDKRWSSPYFWAGFVLQGDWK